MLGARWLKKRRQRTRFYTRQSDQSHLDLHNATATTGGTGYAVAGAFALAIRTFLHIAAHEVTLAVAGAAVVRRPLALEAPRVILTG